MNQFKNCGSKDIAYCINAEHLDFETNEIVRDDGWVCSECQCFHIHTGEQFEYYAGYKEPSLVNYSQIMQK